MLRSWLVTQAANTGADPWSPVKAWQFLHVVEVVVVLLHVSTQSKLCVELLVAAGAGEGPGPPVDGLHVVPLHRPRFEGGAAHLAQEGTLLGVGGLKHHG